MFEEVVRTFHKGNEITSVFVFDHKRIQKKIAALPVAIYVVNDLIGRACQGMDSNGISVPKPKRNRGIELALSCFYFLDRFFHIFVHNAKFTGNVSDPVERFVGPIIELPLSRRPPGPRRNRVSLGCGNEMGRVLCSSI